MPTFTSCGSVNKISNWKYWKIGARRRAFYFSSVFFKLKYFRCEKRKDDLKFKFNWIVCESERLMKMADLQCAKIPMLHKFSVVVVTESDSNQTAILWFWRQYGTWNQNSCLRLFGFIFHFFQYNRLNIHFESDLCGCNETLAELHLIYQISTITIDSDSDSV